MKAKKAGKRGRIGAAIRDNIGLKLLALVASIGLFVLVRGTEDAQISVAVNIVRVMPDEDSRMLVSEIPSEVRLTLRGSRSVLDGLSRQPIPSIQMDLRDTQQHFFYFDRDAFELPMGATIVQMAPAAVPVTWVDTAERSVPVAPVLEGQVRAGYELVNTEVEPARVSVRGAAPEVLRLESVRTAAMQISGLGAGRHERRVPLSLLSSHTSYDELSVQVTVTIEEQESSRTLEELEVAVVGGTGVIVRPASVSVHLSGPHEQLARLPAGRIVPFVDIGGVSFERGAQPVAIQLRGVPERLEARADPAEVLVLPAGE